MSPRTAFLFAVASLLAAGPRSGLAAWHDAALQQSVAELGGRIASACSEAPVVILGERHRQPQSHTLFLSLVEAFAARGERILVALEIASDRQADLDAALRGIGPAEGVAYPALECDSYAGLIRNLGRLAERLGPLVEVRAIDAPWSLPGGRDREMASRIDAALRGEEVDRVVALVGNLHALKVIPWAPGANQSDANLAGLLARDGIGVVSLLQRFGDSCTDESPLPSYTSDPSATGAAVQGLWSILNTATPHPEATAELAADGVISWGCAD